MLKASRDKEVPDPLEELRKAAQQNPQDPETQRRLAWAYYNEKRFDEAREVLEAALSRFPGDVEVLYTLGLTLKSTGEMDRAVESFRAAVETEVGGEAQVRHDMLRQLAKRQIEIVERES